jgi:hypothetical protein
VDGGQAGDVYDMALAVALEEQEAACKWTIYTASLHGACLRRAARWLAIRGHSLGTISALDMQAFIPRWDAGIEEAEANSRRGGFA